MSFTQMKRDDLYDLAVNNFAVDVDERATKPQIIAALAEEGVTWEMAKAFDPRAAEIEPVLEAGGSPGAITTDSYKVPVEEVSVDPVPDLTVLDEESFIRVPRGVDGYVKDNVFTPGEVVSTVVEAPTPQVVLIKMDRANPTYEVQGYKFTQENPFALVQAEHVERVLTHETGFKVASPAEAREFYG